MLARAVSPYQAFRDSTPCLLHACHPLSKRTKKLVGKGAPSKHHHQTPKPSPCLNQQSLLNSQDSQLVAYLKGDFSSTYAGKSLPQPQSPYQLSEWEGTRLKYYVWSNIGWTRMEIHRRISYVAFVTLYLSPISIINSCRRACDIWDRLNSNATHPKKV